MTRTLLTVGTAVAILYVSNSLVYADLDYGKVERPSNATDQVATQNSVPFYWLASYEGAAYYEDKDCETEIGKLGFREEFFELWRDDDTVLLARGESTANNYSVDSVVGYVKQQELIGSRNNVYRGKRSSSNGIHLKAIVVHRWDRGGQAIAAEATLRDQPSANGKDLGSVNLFEFLYIYAVSADSPDGFCLVGTGPFLEVADKNLQSERLLGWLPNRRVFFWDHREGVEYNKDPDAFRWRKTNDQPVKSFSSTQSEANDTPIGPGDLVPAYTEDLEQPDPWLFYMPRYPVISQTPIVIDGQEYLKLGVIGDTYEAGTDSPVADASLEARIRLELNRMENDTRKLDVLFIIDGTGSMKRYYNSIKKSILRIQKDLKESRGNVPIRYGVLYYRDYIEEADPNSWSHYFVDFVTESTFAAKFPHVVSDGGEDNPPTFYAIDTAVQKASWEDGSMRAVILIGDMGNEQPDKKGYDVEKVVQTLRQYRCDFFAIQAEPQFVAKNPVRKLFNDQAEDIAMALEMPLEQAKVLSADGFDVGAAVSRSVKGANQKAEVLRNVLKMLEDANFEFTDAIAKALKDAGIDPGELEVQSSDENDNSGSHFRRRSWGSMIAQELKDRFKEKQIDVSLFAKKRIQHFGIAYSLVRMKGAEHDSFTTRVLLSRAEFQEFTSLVSRIRRKGVTASNVSELWRGLAIQLTGDLDQEVTFDENTPLSDYMERVLGIPIRSELLMKNVTEIKRMDPNELATLRQTLVKVNERMNYYDNNMTPDGAQTENHWFPMRQNEYAWVPLDIMP